MPHDQPQLDPEEDNEAEAPGAWIFSMLANMGMLGPEIEEEEDGEDVE